MHILRIEHQIKDFDPWKVAFDRDPIGRHQSGVRRHRILRPVDDPNYAMLDLEFESAGEPEASHAAAQRQGRDSGDTLAVTARTLRKRLHERGLLTSTDQKQRGVLTVRRTLESSRREVLHTSKDFLSIHANQPDQPDHDREKPSTNGDSVPPHWSGEESPTQPTLDHEPDQERNGRVSEEHRSGHDRIPDHESDQPELLTHGNSTNGRIDRVFDEGREKDADEGARARRVKGRI